MPNKLVNFYNLKLSLSVRLEDDQDQEGLVFTADIHELSWEQSMGHSVVVSPLHNLPGYYFGQAGASLKPAALRDLKKRLGLCGIVEEEQIQFIVLYLERQIAAVLYLTTLTTSPVPENGA